MRFIIAGLMLAFSAGAMAQNAGPTYSLGFSYLSDEVDLGLIQATFGYSFEVGDGVRLVPEIRAGLGVIDDTVTEQGIDVDLKVDNYYGVLGRVEFDVSDQAYLFVFPSYTRIEVEASAEGPVGTTISASASSWEFGGGAGVGFSFTDRLGLEGGYENIDGIDIFNISLRGSF